MGKDYGREVERVIFTLNCTEALNLGLKGSPRPRGLREIRVRSLEQVRILK